MSKYYEKNESFSQFPAEICPTRLNSEKKSKINNNKRGEDVKDNEEEVEEVGIAIREVKNRKLNRMNGMAAVMPEDDLVTFDDHLESNLCYVDAETKQD